MRRILFLNPSGEIGGAERSLLNLVNSIHRADPEAAIHLIVTKDGPLAQDAAKAGVQVVVVPMPQRMMEVGDSIFKGRSRLTAFASLARRAITLMPSQMRYVRQLRRAIAQIQPTVIHSNGFKTHILSWLVRWPHAPVLWHLRDFLLIRPIVPRVLRIASGRVSAVIAISQSVANDARQVLPKTPVHVVYNGVDVDNFTPGPYQGPWLEELAGLPAAPADVVRVGIIAAYARWKGQDLFLQAAAQYLKDRPSANVRFFIIGGPIYTTLGSQFSQEELRTLAEQLGITPFVGFIGFQKNTAPMYRALDVVVHASTQPEPFGLTIAEGMASGRAVIVSRAGGAAELFTHNADALGFTPGDAADLRQAMQALIEDVALRQRIAAHARQTVITRFNRTRVGPEVLAVYDKVEAQFRQRHPRKARPPASVAEPSATSPSSVSLAQLGPKFRVVFMDPVGELGGAERNLLDIITVLRQALPQAKMHLICFSDGPFCKAVERLGVGVTVLPLPNQIAMIGDSALKGANVFAVARQVLISSIFGFRSVLRYSKLLRNTLAGLEPSIIHTNGIKCHVISALVDFPNVPVLWQMQDFSGSRPVVRRALNWAGKSAAGAIAISQAVGTDMQAVAPCLSTTVIYSGIDTDDFHPSDQHCDLDALAGLPPAAPGTLRVALIAAYARWKGQDVFLDAAAQVLREVSDIPVRFYIVGGPIYKTQGSQFTADELRTSARVLKIESAVGFVPFQQDVAQIYRGVDICVHASTQPEPFGRTIVEAMATAKPVIVSQTGGAAELFSDGHDALGVPPGDASALAQAIIRLVRDPALRATLSANGRATAVGRFSRGRMASEFIELYERTLRQHPATRQAVDGGAKSQSIAPPEPGRVPGTSDK